MIEVYGDAWATANSFNALCITTNGIVKKDGELVMGAGIAKDCARRYKQIPALLGQYVKQYGNRVFNLGMDNSTGIRLVSFPTKHNWRDKSDIELIKTSAIQLKELADTNNWSLVLLPRPGCSNGQLKWEDVRNALEPILDNRFYVISNNPADIATMKCNDFQHQQQAPNILECSSKGDQRFSAKFATVNMFGKMDTIERHYQLCKRFGNAPAPTETHHGKGKKPTHIEINGTRLNISYLTPWYKLLWLVYLDYHPDLVDHASTFDDYNDMYRGSCVNCQADVIRQYVKQGRESIVLEVKELEKILANGKLIEQTNNNIVNNVQPVQYKNNITPAHVALQQMIDSNEPDELSDVPFEIEDKTSPVNLDFTQGLTAVCVTGHRPKDLWGYNSCAKYQQLQNKIYYCLKQFHDMLDVRMFINGGAQGVDQLFGAVAQYIVDYDYKDCINCIHVPFEGQERLWSKTGKFSQQEYFNMLNKANRYIVVDKNLDVATAQKWEIGKALTDRNISMVDASIYVLGVYKGDINKIYGTDNEHSGTLHCLQYAYQQGKKIVVINPFTLQTTRINF